MKKIIFIFIIFTALFVGIKLLQKKSTTALYTIGILQTASHPALDAARDGFIKKLKTLLGDSIDFVVQNAQGSVANAHTIAEKFHHDTQIHAIYAIATPATQAICALEKEKPIFIGAVTDPFFLGIMHSATNVCGTQDMIDVAAEVKMLTELAPLAKTVGLIFTSGERNSEILAQKMKLELEQLKLTVFMFIIGSETDIPTIVETALRKSDVLLSPTDNTIASSVSLIATACLKQKKPFIVSDNLLVPQGPLAAQGVDYYESGERVGEIAYKVLTQKIKPSELSLENAQTDKIIINKTTLDALGLIIPESLQDHVTFVS